MKNTSDKALPSVSPIPPARAPIAQGGKPIPTHRQIAAAAEVLWRQRGCPTGDNVQIWLDAERQLDHLPRVSRDKWERFAQRNPLSRLDMSSADVMSELEELFPNSSGAASTAL